MGSNWQSIDNNFPTFLGGEKLTDQVRLLHDFLPVLIEALKYQLNNLDASNWNATAMKSFQEDTTKELEDAVDDTGSEMARLIRELENLNERVARLNALIQDVQLDMGLLERQAENTENRLDTVEQMAETAVSELDTISLVLVKNEDGSYTMGTEGGTLHLVGTVTVNGEPL